MSLPTIADTYRVAIDYVEQASDLKATNVIHILAPSSDEDSVFALLDASVTNSMWETASDGTNVVQVVITKLDGTPDGRVFGPSALTGDWPTGSGSTDFNPQVCSLIKLATAATGRSGRGRIFIPWLQDALVSRGQIDDTARGNQTDAWVDFSNALVAGDMALAVASYLHATASQVLNLSTEKPSATQRRRQVR